MQAWSLAGVNDMLATVGSSLDAITASNDYGERMPPRNPPEDVDPVTAKQTIVEYCLRKGALIAGVADLAAVERIAPAGHRPSDLMPRVKSVIAVGVGGATQGAWRVPAKALSYFGSTESRHIRSFTDLLSISSKNTAHRRSIVHPTWILSLARVIGCKV